MTKVNIALQDKFLDSFFQSAHAGEFCLTGGTALARFYFYHRESVDLDLFTNNQQVDFDSVNATVRGIVTRLGKQVIREIVTDTFIQYIVEDSAGSSLKVDFVKDVPIHFGEIASRGRVRLDSIENIGSNKILTIFGRTDAKDFIDLFWIIKNAGFSFDHLYNLAKQKDLGLNEFYLAEGIYRLNQVKKFPHMLKPINSRRMRQFYKQLHKTLLQRIKPAE